MAASTIAANDFKSLLVTNPQLANGELVLELYSKDLMFNNAKSRTRVILPDKKPLPSLITSISSECSHKGNKSPPRACALWEAADDEFVMREELGLLSGWNHECLTQLIYRLLAVNGRDVDDCLDAIQRVENVGFTSL